MWLAATAAQAASNGPPELPGVTDEPPGAETPREPAPPPETTEPTEPPPESGGPSEPGTEPPSETTPTEPTEPPSDFTEPTEPTEPGEPPSDFTSPTEPEPPPPSSGGAAPTPPPAMTTPPPSPPPTARPSSPPPSAPASSTPVQRPAPATTASPSSAPAETKPTANEADDDRKRSRRAKDDDDDEQEDDDDDEKKDKKKFKHRGFFVDVRAGAIGCTKAICKNHNAKPGFRLDGLVGRNFFGFFDLALAGGWGTLGANVAPGTDGLSLYGLDPAALPPEAALLMFDGFTVDSARLETISAGLDLRVHILPRGRFDPYVGIGAQYTLFRALYQTPDGRSRMGFHGLGFPLQGGFVVYALERIAFGAQFDYIPTWYGGITMRGAIGDFAAPIPVIKDAAAMAGIDLPGDLPQFWTVGGVLHLRLGKK